jgi:hypothetical protein
VEPPPEAKRFEGVVSIVVGDPRARVRRLPSLYLGPSLVFAARREDGLRAHLDQLIELLQDAPEKPTYALTPVRLEDRVGVYARDMSVRDTFRMLLRRHGLVFAEEPFVRLNEARFTAGEWGVLPNDFIILGHYDEEDPEKVLETSGAFVPFTLATFRLGAVSPTELRQLARLSSNTLALSSANAPNLIDALRERLPSTRSVTSS